MKENSPSVAFFTLGCKVNQNETEAMSALFCSKGYTIVEFEDKADIYVINTCTVTHLADRKSRQIIHRCTKNNPHAVVAVVGCYAQISPGELEKIPGVRLILGTTNKKNIVELLEGLDEKKEPRVCIEDIQTHREFAEIGSDKFKDRIRAYLKIQDGCEQFCTYCIIPYARGPLRSRSLHSTLEEADRLAAAGFKEIVLTGIHVGLYGRDLPEKYSLEKLLQDLLRKYQGIRWRIGSLEPMELSLGILQLMKEYPELCPQLHLPLQAAHNDILQAMNRPYTTEDYRRVLEMARTAMPDIAITTDIMVGFPGETEEHFQASLAFVQEMSFSGMHVFKYSPRQGTPAAKMPNQLSAETKEKRSNQMRLLARRSAVEYAESLRGRKLKVLAEKKSKAGIWEGHSENYLLLHFVSKQIKRGDLACIELSYVEGENVFGREVLQ